MAINGRKFSWEDIKITMPHGKLVDVDSIDYEDSRKVNRIYGAGSGVQGYSKGNYEGKGKVSLLREEYVLLVEEAGSDGIYGLEPFEITITYKDKDGNEQGVTLPDCLFVSRKTSSKQQDEKVMYDIEFEILSPIVDRDFSAFDADQ
jgi:hypothetical protein